MSGPRALLAAFVVLGLALAATSFTGARFTAKTSNAGNAIAADKTSSYLRLYSQATNPGGLTGYAVRAGSSPSVPAATFSDDALAVNLGGYNNANGTAVNRVFTITTPATLAANLPAGVTSITVALSVVADAGGEQPISDYAIATTANGSAAKTVSMAANSTRQVNLTIRTKNLTAGAQLTPAVVVKVGYTGYAGNFLSYVVPIKVYTGNGAGPN